MPTLNARGPSRYPEYPVRFPAVCKDAGSGPHPAALTVISAASFGFCDVDRYELLAYFSCSGGGALRWRRSQMTDLDRTHLSEPSLV